MRKERFESVVFFTKDLLRQNKRKKRNQILTICSCLCLWQHLFKKSASFFSFLIEMLKAKQTNLLEEKTTRNDEKKTRSENFTFKPS